MPSIPSRPLPKETLVDNSLTLALDTLRETVRETFETIAFSEISSWEVVPDVPDSMNAWIGAAIDICQPVHCRYTLLIDREQCREFMETAYDPEISEDPAFEGILADYVGELVNTIAGRFAASLAQPGGDIELGLPQSCGIPPAAENMTVVTFLLEDTVARCYLEML